MRDKIILHLCAKEGSTIGNKFDKFPKDAEFRSRCPIGFAKAFFEANP